jgi:transposase InsO family protein
MPQTAATVGAHHPKEGMQKQEKKRGRVKTHRRPRPRGQQDTKTSRRKRKKEARQKTLLASVKKSLSAVEHDSSDLIVVQGSVDGQHCRDMLVDPGASSNFVRRDWAQSHRLRMRELQTPLDVTLADGQFAGRLTGAVVVKSLQAQGSSAPCTLIIMDQLSHHVILGMPWLRRAGVTLGLDKETTWNGKPLCRMKMNGERKPQLQAIKVAPEYEHVITALCQKYAGAFSKNLPRRSKEAVKRAIHCRIQLKDPHCRPVVSRERRRSEKDTQTLIDTVKEMEAAGLIQPSESPWSSQPLLVRKMREGVELPEKRPCWDYRWVNDLIVSDAHPLPLPEDMFDKLQGCRLFSKLDLTKGFWQIPMEEASKKVLAMATPLGLYEPNFMPFGMKNAPAVFQREMQRVLRDRLYRGVMVFVDDILIYSKTADEHTELVEWVLRRLQEEGYVAHPDKCEFFQREVSFLGHVISERGITVQQHKVRAVNEWPQPRNKRDVRAFLGMSGYYRKFIPCYSDIAAPLTDLTKKDVKFEWTEREQAAFELLQYRLTSADVLAHPNPRRPYFVTTDASDFATSGVLSQEQDDGTMRPIAYFSRKMDDRERHYATHDKELLALVLAIDHWRCYLEGSEHPIMLRSDHRSLQHLSTQPNLNARQVRWVEKLSEFDFVIGYVPGKENAVADALSRRPDFEPTTDPARSENDEDKNDTEVRPRLKVRLAVLEENKARPQWQVRVTTMPLRDEMKRAAQADPEYKKLLDQPEPRTDGRTVGDGLLWTADGLFYVPNDRELQQRLIHEVHDTPTGGHMGLSKTWARLSSTCWWPGMRAMIEDYVRGCQTCAATKPELRRPAGLLHPLPIPERPWQVISIDFVGPLPRTPDHFDMVLVVIDKFSKMAHFIATTSHATAKHTAKLLLEHVIRLHGVPEAIISDRGTQFTAKLFRKVWEQLGTDLRLSTAYHPQSDGQTERVIRELEQQLRWHADKTGTNWKEWLSVVEMHYNSTQHSSTNKTPFEMNGTNWRDPFALALQKPRTDEAKGDGAEEMLRELRITWEDARQVMLRQREQQKKYADQRRRDEQYQVGDLVMLRMKDLAQGRTKLSDRYAGPFRVTEVRDNGVNVRLDLPAAFKRIHPVFHVEKIKRFAESQQDWPGRPLVERPPPVLVDGTEQYWAKRILDKRVVQREVEVREKIDQQPPPTEEKKTDSETHPPVQGRRISPRDHASTRSLDVPTPQLPPRAKTRVRKIKKNTTEFLVEWEGYELADATWEPEENLLASNCHELINDYYRRQLDSEDDDNAMELATMYTFSAGASNGGVVQLHCRQV